MTTKILFVDDDRLVLDAVRRRLRNRFAIDMALGAEQGLEMVRAEGPYAVIVSDMNMPGMDGITFLGRAREVSPDSIPMVLTGDANLDTAVAAVNSGNVFRFMTKPCPRGELEQFLEAGIRQHQLVEADKRAAVLELASRAKSDFLATVSHELRTPLTVLKAAAEILNSGADQDAEVRADCLGAVQDGSERLGRVIEQLLDMAQLDAGLVALDAAPFDLCELLAEVVEQAHCDGVEVRLAHPTAPVICEGDRDRLKGVFAQMLGNAVSHSPVNEVIDVLVAESADRYEVIVRDRGPGVPIDRVERIFEPFVQRDEVLVDKPPGLGLGLAIAKRVLDLHDASLSCEEASDGAGGAIFSVSFAAHGKEG